ncbi:MAG: hypothetical protein ACC628_12755, partial [Pirellulaceae bacterium]
FRGRGDKKSRAKRNKTDSPQTANASQHSTFSSGQPLPQRREGLSTAKGQQYKHDARVSEC